MATCTCPADDACAGAGSDACSLAAAYRKGPQLLGPAVCGDLDSTGNVVVGPCGTDLCIVHEPIDPCEYRTSLGVGLQTAVDNARRVSHQLGLRPYRVFLVWVRRDRRQIFQEYRRQELMPVTVGALTDVDLELRAVGLDQVGGIRLSRISPNQVDDATLRGHFNGEPLPSGDEFFYEVVRSARCSGEKPQRVRFNIASTPYYNATRFQWEVDIASQKSARDPDGDDTTFEPARGRGNRLKVLRR